MESPTVNLKLRVPVPCWLAFYAVLLSVAPEAVEAAVSYDSDGDGQIEISTLAQLNAVRWDLDGDGAVDNSANAAVYAAAFPNAATDMGCPTTADDADDYDCSGYELAVDLDFDTDGDGAVNWTDDYWNSGAGWAPISEFATTFEGNGHAISNLYINRTTRNIGLFGSVSTGGQVRNVAVRDVAVTGSGQSNWVGGLVGVNRGIIIDSYATGEVANSGNGGVGGLVGGNHGRGRIVASYATGVVTGSGGISAVGGLVGSNYRFGRIVASYATGAVTGSGNGFAVGGLVAGSSGSIVASYATGAVTGSGVNFTVGGLEAGSSGSIVASYWNIETSRQASSGGGVGKTTMELCAPTGYTGIYANWNLDLDGDNTDDDPWDFGTASEYPVLRRDFDGDGDIDADDVDPQRTVASSPSSIPVSTVSYDSDGDGLIEIRTLAQLNAIRWDLDGDGAVDSGTNRQAYTTAFPDAVASMGCALVDHDEHPATPDVPVCTGYELKGDLDFDTDGDGDVDNLDEYWHSGEGWDPIGSPGTGNEFIATFEGNDHTISRLYIDRSSSRIGLFGVVGNGGRVRNLGVVDVDVSGSSRGVIVGGLAGKNAGIITGSHVTGSVTSTGAGSSEVGGLVGRNGGSSDRGSSIAASYTEATVTGPGSSFRSRVGGLAGYNYGSIRASYASGAVTGTGNQSHVGGLVGLHNGGKIAVCYATGAVTGKTNVGGLVGQNDVSIGASYATGAVTGDDSAGGLVGYNQWGYIRAGYATGWVTSSGSDVGGLVGRNQGSGVSNSYWNTTTSGRVSSTAGEGKTTGELQTPSGYTGIYAAWNLDLDNADGDSDTATGGDEPWDFGTAQQYPALRADFDGDGMDTWQEFGRQRPDASPTTGGTTGSTTDFNGDGRTDFVDFFLFADAYGSTNAKFDLDGNGTVDFADFFKFVDAFGS